MRGLVSMLAVTALGLAFCHPTDRPPVPPPKPTDPTVAQRAPAEVIDASIVSDGGAGWRWDGGGFELDTGATLGRAQLP
jgi:hypothetical protein